MLGSFPPAKKRWSMDFFYPNFTNDMWRIMGLVFFGDKDHFVDQEQKTFRKECIIDFLNEQGIALYDTATAVVRTKNTASDKDLEVVEPTDLFTKYFNMEQPRVGASEPFVFDGRPMRLFRMPSSSRAYPMRVEQKAEYYQALFKSAENRKIAK